MIQRGDQPGALLRHRRASASFAASTRAAAARCSVEGIRGGPNTIILFGLTLSSARSCSSGWPSTCVEAAVRGAAGSAGRRRRGGRLSDLLAHGLDVDQPSRPLPPATPRTRTGPTPEAYSEAELVDDPDLLHDPATEPAISVARPWSPSFRPSPCARLRPRAARRRRSPSRQRPREAPDREPIGSLQSGRSAPAS